VIPVQEQVEKIRAAVFARGDSNLVIVGRTYARAIEGLKGAIARAERYLEAGTDVLFIEGGKTPNLSVQELEEMGYKLAAFALSGLFSVTQAMKDCFGRLKHDGSTENINRNLSFEQFKEVIQIDKHIEFGEEIWAFVNLWG
jgi:methylisocitrate lyase